MPAWINLRDHQDEVLRRPITIAVVGAGGRGTAYAGYAAKWPERAKIVAVAETRDGPRGRFAVRHSLEPKHVYTDWREMTARGRIADAVIVTAPALTPSAVFIEQGYDVLLEKPASVTEDESAAVGAAAARSGATVAVSQILRYTPYTQTLRELLPSIGDIVSVEHLEPIGTPRFTHTYVRGGHDGAAMLDRTCRVLDWLGYLIGRPVVRTSSFGGLHHFRPENRPSGAAERCLDCPLRANCTYSAVSFYTDGLLPGSSREPYTRAITGGELTSEALTWALANGPYGRCVYGGGNDVSDHQVVNLEYSGGVTASFTITAFAAPEQRHTRFFGTRGQLSGDGRTIRLFDFSSEETTTLDTAASGGAENLTRSFVDALHLGRPDLIRSGIAESLASHRVVAAAERARRTGTVVTLSVPSGGPS